jgi:hypothetical protein
MMIAQVSAHPAGSIERRSRALGVNLPADCPLELATGFEQPDAQWSKKVRQLRENVRPSRRAI